MRIILAFLWRDILDEMSYKLSFFMQLLNIFPVMLVFFFISKMVGNTISGPLAPYGGSYFPFVLIGVAVQYYLSVALGSFSATLRGSQLSGSLEAVLATPISPFYFLAGSAAYGFAFNSLRVLLYLAMGSLIFGINLSWIHFPVVLLTLVLSVTAFSSLGILSASFIMVFKRGDPLNWAFTAASWLLGGVYYPVSVLPVWLQKLAMLVPMTHSLESLRRSLLCNEGITTVGPHLLALFVWSALGLPLSLFCFKWALDRARIQGTLGHY